MGLIANAFYFVAAFCLLPAIYCEPLNHPRVVCYHQLYEYPYEFKQDFNASLCTHLIFAFYPKWCLDEKPFSSQERTEYLAIHQFLQSFTQKKDTVNPELKLMLGITGDIIDWSKIEWGSLTYFKNRDINPESVRFDFSALVKNDEEIKKFTQKILALLREIRFDGLDIDWEYPGNQTSDKVGYSKLLTSLRKAFNEHGYVLSISAPPVDAVSNVDAGYNLTVANQTVNFIRLVTTTLNYDKKTADHFFPLYARDWDKTSKNIDDSVKFWLSKGFPASKIVVSIAMFIHTWNLAEPSNFTLPARALGEAIIAPFMTWVPTPRPGYGDVCEILNRPTWQRLYDSSGASYALSGSQLVVLNDITTVRSKAEYIVSKGLGGAALRYIGNDDCKDACGDGKFPLMKVVYETLRQAKNLQKKEQKPPKIFACPRKSGDFKDPQTCSRFYRCFNGKALNVLCPRGLYFNPQTSTCDLPSNAFCDNFSCPGESGIYPHPDSCTSFYACAYGTATKVNCPSGLYFNPSTSMCDFQTNVASCPSKNRS